MDTQVLLKVTSISDLQKLNEFLETTSISSKVMTSNVSATLDDHYYNYKPTQEFKDFCGGECLNRYGLISLASAKAMIVHYATKNGLYTPTTILMDDTLRKILATTGREVSYEELYERIKALFVRC